MTERAEQEAELAELFAAVGWERVSDELPPGILPVAAPCDRRYTPTRRLPINMHRINP